MTKGISYTLGFSDLLSPTGALAIQAPEVIAFCLKLEAEGKPDYLHRLSRSQFLDKAYDGQAVPECGDRVSRLLYKHPSDSATLTFNCYRSSRGFRPVFANGSDIAGRPDYFHNLSQSAVVALCNATAPGAIEWAQSIRGSIITA